MSNQGTREKTQVIQMPPDSHFQHGRTSEVMFSLLPVALMLSALWRLSQGLGLEILLLQPFTGKILHMKSSRQTVSNKMPFFLPKLRVNQSSGHGSEALADKQL